MELDKDCDFTVKPKSLTEKAKDSSNSPSTQMTSVLLVSEDGERIPHAGAKNMVTLILFPAHP